MLWTLLFCLQHAELASQQVVKGIAGENPHYYRDDRKVFLELARLLLLYTDRYATTNSHIAPLTFSKAHGRVREKLMVWLRPLWYDSAPPYITGVTRC